MPPLSRTDIYGHIEMREKDSKIEKYSNYTRDIVDRDRKIEQTNAGR
jgi:hypothetical protein